MPPLNCVEGAIISVPEVRHLRMWEDRGSYPLTWSGIKQPDRLYYFEYEAGDTIGMIVFSINYAGKIEYSQHYSWRSAELAIREVGLIRPIMVEIEQRLEQRRSIATLLATIEEHCSGIDCPVQ